MIEHDEVAVSCGVARHRRLKIVLFTTNNSRLFGDVLEHWRLFRAMREPDAGYVIFRRNHIASLCG
jgi:hypothetical protein